MRAQHRAALFGLALLGCVPTRSWSAEPPAATAAPEPSHGQITIVPISGAPAVLTNEDIAQLPTIDLPVSFDTEHGPRQAIFTGPLLWTVLDHVHAIDPSKPRDEVRQALILTGMDGYTAVLALGEIAPAFAGKQVLLAERIDGKPFESAHLRVVVPGEVRGGRSVRDVVRIAVIAPTAAP